MKLTNTSNSFGLMAKILHWVMAIIILSLFGVGLYMTDLTYYDSLYHVLPWWHKSFGLLILTLLIFRFLWHQFDRKPEPLATHKPWEHALSSGIHKLFYLLILFICISGYLISTAKGKGIEFFGWFDVPALLTSSSERQDFAGEIHLILAYILIGSVVLHVAGAVKHQLFDKDNTLRRML